jgi:hypothetical protein
MNGIFCAVAKLRGRDRDSWPPGVPACPEVRYWTPTYRRDEELAALISPAVRVALTAQDITLTNYRDL